MTLCSLCGACQPWAEECVYETGAAASATESDQEPAAPMAEFTYDQIADQLTDGYWSNRHFDVSSGGTLYVDTSGLATNGQTVARYALDAWTAVTGINFVEADGSPAANNTISETGDASGSTSTNYSMSVGDDFLGSLSTGSDRDYVEIQLTAGQTLSLQLEGEGSGGTADPYLWLRSSSGTILAQNDDAIGQDSGLDFQAQYTGTYYIEAGSFNNAYPGDYRISARETSQSVDIVFDDNNAGAYASPSVSGGIIQSAFVNVNASWSGGQDRVDGYYLQTYIHEIGHALGLGHAGNYNGNATYGVDNLYDNDSWQATIMSYFHQTENPNVDASFAYVITPQVADILAIQNLYGPATANVGDTTYGDGGNSGYHIDGAASLSNPVSYSVFDSDGIDTFDFSSYSAHQNLNLNQEAYSDLAGLTGNIGIARNTVIENGLTGYGNDTITGNAADNGLSAGSGTDVINGGAGNDAIHGGAGNDDLDGGTGFDFIVAGKGDNTLEGGDGSDLLIGDNVSLNILTLLYPTWTPPSDAQTIMDDGEIWVLWDDILTDQGIV